MMHPSPIRTFAGVCCLLLLGFLTPAAQGAAAAPHAPLTCQETPATSGLCILAEDDGWSFKHLFRGFNNRSRVVQVCVVVMALGLFILMKK
jgi:hypothetical protein